MDGDLPPNSNVTGIKFSAPHFAIILPVAVEPVNDDLLIIGELAKCCPATAPNPGTILTTPSGNPTSCNNLPIYKAVNGVSSDTLLTIVLPHASAVAAGHAHINKGKFHGVTAPTTPSGSLIVLTSNGPSEAIVSPCIFLANADIYLKYSIANPTSPFDDDIGLPLSKVSNPHNISKSLSTKSANLYKIRERSLAVYRFHGPLSNAFLAAFNASSTSSVPASLI
mmetsp:Transcript_2679/g.3308  ORF Transcript_2679/g.3308 Transcript_2679/m.3308 type:complete len:224 (+) Transcript_2679:812-1483(+)